MDEMEQVARAYDQEVEREWMRLVKDTYHSLEYTVTWRYLRKHLPPSGVVLDAGGGPGRYSRELCRAGYQVVLLDLSPGCIAMARDKFAEEPEAVRERLLEATVGDVRDLSVLETDHFDAVLCLAPLSHISDGADRHRALLELVRVAKPGAMVSLSVMGYLAVLRTVMAICSDELLSPKFPALLEQGNDHHAPGGMVWHFFRAEEIRQCAESCGLETIEMAGCQGLSTGLEDATNRLAEDRAKWKLWLDVVVRTSAEPAVVDMAEHILYVGRKGFAA
jgi:ubiquinone/menaquinone biosynthesis C-methylase UbiE